MTGGGGRKRGNRQRWLWRGRKRKEGKVVEEKKGAVDGDTKERVGHALKVPPIIMALCSK